MTISTNAWPSRRKWILAVVGLPVLAAIWWAFRPEKLWVNAKVNEPAPFETGADPQPFLTGRFEGKAEQTSGRATIYKKAGGGEYLRLSDFTTTSAHDAHVVLARSESDSDRIDLGPLKSDQGDQNYDLPAATDVKTYSAAAIYSEQSHATIGVAKLEPF
jgi:Electron transfer DM13